MLALVHIVTAAGSLNGALQVFLFLVIYLLAGLVPVCGILYLLYFLLTIPMRRNERARLFLDLLELGLKQGRTPEATITDAATSRERSFGVRFYLFAEHLRQGKRLSEALVSVPRLLPPRITGILQAGERVGDIAKVLPACRESLKDGVSQVRGALNYVLVLIFATTPALILVPFFFNTVVLPKFQEIFSSMVEAPLPAFTRLVFMQGGVFAVIQLATFLFLWLLVLAYLGGPRLTGWINRITPALPERLALLLPWRKKRLQRDFSALLALLLDARVPEREAVAIAANACANSVFARRAGRVQVALGQGVKLQEALAALDDERELQWRLSNALHARGGFARALTGWHDSLDAKAFQLEQTAAQVTTTIVVLLNGFMVGCIVIGIFITLIQLIQDATLW